MYYNVSEILEITSDKSNLVGIIIGSGIFGSFSAFILRYIDAENKKKATLYYPLFLACTAIIEVINENETIGMVNSKKQLVSSSKILDQIFYNHGSLIYLEGNNLDKLLKMKGLLDRNIQSFEDLSWKTLKDLLISKDFVEIKSNAADLLDLSQRNVKTLRTIQV